jgi:prepilin-type N-terminal cleavage/methylation domain-containing protein
VFALGHIAGALRRPFALLSRRLDSARAEAGFTLVEVIVSAALLAVVGGGVYAGIDGPARVSGNSKARATAANLAQTDQEQMRAKRFVDLQNYSQTYTRTGVNGVNYTITSRADWVDDSTAKAGCTVGNGQGDYLRLSSSVSWPNGGPGNPVTVTSLMAPPVDDGTNGTGNIVMRLKDQAGAPVAGIPVTADGRTTVTRITDAGGCAVFTALPAGDYAVTWNTVGYVDNMNLQSVSVPAPLRAGDTVQLEHLYAKAMGVQVNFVNSAGGSINWPKASVAGGSLISPLRLSGAAPLTTGKTLFPVTSGNYVAWAGSCADPGAAYDGVASPNPAPDITSVATVTVPTLTITAPAGGIITSAPHLVAKPNDGSCGDTFSVPTPTNSNGAYSWPIPLPYGKYAVCADMLSFKTATPFVLDNLTKTGSTVALSLITDPLGNVTGVKATPITPSGPSQTVGVGPGVCS